METAMIIRPARPGDRPAMERICAHTWEWGDYIPEAWDDWLEDEQGQLIVGELAGSVVALSMIAFEAPGQIWLEGMRVDPEYRRRGIAEQFLDHSIAFARERGARVVRLGTSSHNAPVHIVTARAGMVRVGAYLLWIADPLPGGPDPVFLSAERADQVRAFLHDSPVMAHTHGLYSVHWAWQELSPARIDQFLKEGQFAARLAADGQLAAIATLHPDPEYKELWLSFAGGEAAAVTELATTVRAYAARLGAEKVQVMVPDLGWLRDALAEAGYGSGDRESELWIFERWLSGEAPDPAGDPTTPPHGGRSGGGDCGS
jgi:GNAT superfamily N-acetyltransferase